ncbi:hypothetical protein Tco_0140423 [Tanacetum coccineum]
MEDDVGWSIRVVIERQAPSGKGKHSCDAWSKKGGLQDMDVHVSSIPDKRWNVYLGFGKGCRRTLGTRS